MAKYIITATRTVYESFEVMADTDDLEATIQELQDAIDAGQHEMSWDEEYIKFDGFEIETL